MAPTKHTRHPSSPTELDLAQQIAELRGITIKGFEAVNNHLATLNGRVGKHDDLFGKILGDEKFQAGTRQGFSVSAKVFLAIITITIGILAIIFGPH
jgi:hypothetical protein